MSLKQECNGPNCQKKTRVDDPTWIKVIPSQVQTFSRPAEDKHYCSWTCVHQHSYLLISGDNGQ